MMTRNTIVVVVLHHRRRCRHRLLFLVQFDESKDPMLNNKPWIKVLHANVLHTFSLQKRSELVFSFDMMIKSIKNMPFI